MKINDIKIALLDSHHQSKNTNKFSVLIPIVELDGKTYLLYETRSKSLRNQPGEICFPGGAVERLETEEIAAQRETAEELRIPIETIEILYEMPKVITPFGTSIASFVGILSAIQTKDDFDKIAFNQEEVESIFLVPIDWLIHHTPRIYTIHSKMDLPEDFPFELIQNGREYGWKTNTYPIYFYEYDHVIIWGITARITDEFIALLRKKEPCGS